ncbi:MAG: hypothetical protein LIP23_09500 [Planctomycetes bacterium]|nr:hypothetical protein [Planctomycetota bacterium]
MSSQPLKMGSEPVSIDDAIDRIITRFRERGRIEMGPEIIRAALRDRLAREGFADHDMSLSEGNLLGSVSVCREYLREERRRGHNSGPDFARQLRTAFLAHCREHQTLPEEAVSMSIELATAIMDLALAFRRQFSIGTARVDSETGDGQEEAEPEERK